MNNEVKIFSEKFKRNLVVVCLTPPLKKLRNKRKCQYSSSVPRPSIKS